MTSPQFDLDLLDWSDSGQVKSLVLALIRELRETRAELEQVKRKLAFYENPHTPSSRRRLKKKTRSSSSGKKRGAPVGHRGVSRSRPRDVEVVVVPAERCECCGSTNLRLLRTKERTIEELPEVREPTATTFVREKVECQGCGHVFTATHPECPVVGRLGVNLMVFVVMLRFLPRSVLRRAVELLEHVYHVKISAATTNSVLSRVAAAATPEYRLVLERIRRARVVHVDETGFKVLGKKWWLWIFRAADDVFYVLRDTRGGDVPREVLGASINQVLVRDGWTAYNTLKHVRVQRCWAHLLREAEEFTDTLVGRHLYQRLQAMFADIKAFNAEDPSDSQRQDKYREFNQRMQKILAYYRRYPRLKKILTYATNGGSQWFTCILIEGVEPTNNPAEQPLREQVIMRQIIGSLQSTHGAKVYETLATLIATWRLQDHNIPQKLKEIITQNLCLTKN